jgi:hypothetical protein
MRIQKNRVPYQTREHLKLHFLNSDTEFKFYTVYSMQFVLVLKQECLAITRQVAKLCPKMRREWN